MDKYLDTRFERVEKALATFIDSIAKYNPSEKLAEDLVAADRELAAGLKELERHQNNHARILQLRQETASLDQQTKDIIGGLWNMRKEVKSTPATQYPATGPKYQFTTHELLNYAKRISRTTLPPAHLLYNSEPSESQQAGGQGGQPMEIDSAAPTPMPGGGGGGTATAAGTPAASAAPTPAASGPSGPGPVTTTTAPFSQPPPPPSANQTALPEDFKPHINLLTGYQFHPWPTEDKVRMGGMAAYQSLVSRAVDPKGYDPEEEERRKKEEEEARKEAEERAIREREEEERRMREERERMARERERARREEAERSGSISGPAAGAPAAAASSAGGGGRSQFTFLDGMDDDDDDDED
ncbi:hypothetical protein GE21DRAFT_6350 [Neurospora crassa]|uniref:Mediator of RNA polymerase II transcription subunit 4 n=1 Tax=Neurospora crassa (strain ATCC 24698 / 74-OR23-1A / CBS 708.71 / DSM 1257 / FGSC 987) TaxID=367110 RepID=Q7SA34_NEUCR|nr:hypothetical protein NCU07329 [Neurospora crassa OR74A]EAA33251.1 hypothetical protein NCU07329 [Neurospora crassa OR74A]KHE88762.1 hypothetical protein GE21DRAFT_6350 [Neurospora crassa]|eukprot:XP_962487.1 hypothetical protein NCU07329 [Neurospora crassa OR74A]